MAFAATSWTTPSPVRRAVVQFLLTSAVAAVVVVIAAGVISQRVAEKEVSQLAAEATQNLALTVSPLVTDGVRAGDPGDLTRLREAVEARTGLGLPANVTRPRSSIERVKIWTAVGGQGTVVFSDRPELIGRTFPLDPDDLAALTSDEYDSELSDVSRPENLYERTLAPVVEAYVGAEDATGRPILVETYFSVDRLQERQDQLAETIAPAVLVPLVLLLLLILPLAVSLARRVARQEAERSTLVRLAAEASATERRAMAAELHDGVVQDLSGVGYALAVVEGRLARPAGLAEEDRRDMLATVRTSLDVVRGDVASLRSIITTLYTSVVEDVDLGSALLTVAADAESHGITVVSDIGPMPALPARTSAAVFQVGREALRNAVEHAQALTLRLTLAADGDEVVLVVEDDGIGFAAPRHGVAEGHLGMSLMSDNAESVDGRLTVTSAVGRGTCVRLVVPLAPRRAPRLWNRVPRPGGEAGATTRVGAS